MKLRNFAKGWKCTIQKFRDQKNLLLKIHELGNFPQTKLLSKFIVSLKREKKELKEKLSICLVIIFKTKTKY